MKIPNNLYIYLARLDKKGIKVISGFEYNETVYPTRVKDISKLNLNPNLTNSISKEAYDNRMNYELFVESATSFLELKSSLSSRGYSNLPMHQFAGYTVPTDINKKALITKESTMIRRASDIRQ